MNDREIDNSKNAIERILSALGVVRVVYVDDAIAANVSLEDVLAAADSLDEKLLLSAFPELGDTIPDDKDVLVAKIRETWARLDAALRDERGQAVIVAARRHDGNEADDVADVADVEILSQLISSDQLISLSPGQWEEQEAQLLRESEDHPTLFLFDRDLSETGGHSEGMRIIASLLAKHDEKALLCGLLTHTVTPETQPQQWDQLSQAHNIPKDRFVVIPKLHLSQAPAVFAQSLKFTALSPDFVELKERAKNVARQASIAAAKRVEEVSIYDLDHIVFRVSAEEGLWEPDMLFRLHAMFHRMESLRLTHDDAELERIAARLRAVSEIPISTDTLAIPNSSWTLQREELYEPPDHVNGNHLPLENGDIFERTDTSAGKKYILLGQPCDLMVRASGKRQPDVRRLALVEIVRENRDPARYWEEIPYFDESPSQRWFVKLKKVHYVQSRILDLCAFNRDGAALLQLDDSPPSGIRPTWKARHSILTREWLKLIRKTDILSPSADESPSVRQFRERAARELCATVYADDLFKGGVSESGGIRSLRYNCRRVGRLTRARAMGMLLSLTATLGRPAFDRDFGR